MFKFLLFALGLSIYNQNSVSFERLICEYKAEELEVSMTKKELVDGFKNIDELECVIEKNVSSFIFISKHGTKVFAKDDFDKIPKYIDELKKGASLELSIIMQSPYLQRRNKIVKVL